MHPRTCARALHVPTCPRAHAPTQTHGCCHTGQNKGKAFWACSKQREDSSRCKFFEYVPHVFFFTCHNIISTCSYRWAPDGTWEAHAQSGGIRKTHAGKRLQPDGLSQPSPSKKRVLQSNGKAWSAYGPVYNIER